MSSCRVLRPDQGQVNGQGHSEGPPQDHSYLDQSLSSRNVPRCQPIAAILLRKPTPSKNVGHRGNINAPVSPFFPSLVRSLFYPPITLFFFFSPFFYSVSRSHARPVDLLGPRIGPVFVRDTSFSASVARQTRSSSPYFHCSFFFYVPSSGACLSFSPVQLSRCYRILCWHIYRVSVFHHPPRNAGRSDRAEMSLLEVFA